MIRSALRLTWLWLVVVYCVACTGGDDGSPGEEGLLDRVTQAVPLGCTAVSLTVTPSGNDAQLDATGTCSGAAEYRFYVREPGASTYTQIYGYGLSSHLYTPIASGQYTFIVHARLQGSGAVYEAATTANGVIGPNVCRSVTVTATPSSVVAGGPNTVTLNANATCTAGESAEYRFFARSPLDKTYTEIRTYGTSSFVYTPHTPSGQWSFIVHARRAGNNSVYESASTAYARGGDNLCTATLATPTVDGSGVVTLQAANVTNTSCDFRFLVREPGASSFSDVQPYTAGASSTTYTPAVAGVHTFTLYTRYTGNTSTYESIDSKNFSVGTTCNAVSLTVTPGGNIHGPVHLAANATCAGAATPDYHFLVIPPGSSAFTELAPWGSSSTFTWNTTGYAAGVYTFVVHTRAAGNGSVYEGAASVARNLMPAPPVLFRLDAEPAGGNCTSAGFALLRGPDQDDNDVLNGAEPTASSTRYLCHPASGATISGDYTVTNAADAAALAGAKPPSIALLLNQKDR